MTLKKLQRKYTMASVWYDATRWMFIRGRRRMVTALGLKAGQRVLEVGCGTGSNLAYYARAVGATGTVVGLDYVRPMLNRARPKAEKLNAANTARVFLVQADGAHLPMLGPFDAVVFSYSLTMIPDWQRAVREAVDVLVNGGTLASLDFGLATGWPPGVRQFLQRWLNAHGVHTQRDFVGEFAARTGDGSPREISIGRQYVRIVVATKAEKPVI